ncbi:MAG: tetratricopeptide repeat protein [Candidatus Aminicenantes bacterium]|nr:tetratricopeptide repeat protein [Candidatus Aminicenantes bacterium]
MKCPKCETENAPETKFCGNCGTSLTSTSKTPTSGTKTLITPKIEMGVGSTFADRYHIIEKLGKGGMGSVYKARDINIDEPVALKILNPEIASDEQTIQRFRNELKLTRKISHRNICRVYDLNEHEGIHFISMEYVSGEDLKSLIHRIGQLTVGKAVIIARQVCEGLHEAHRLGVIHRDLKPQNVMIDREGNAKIMDFGIARSAKSKGLTEDGAIVGTPEYMSPEQVEGREVDGRSDIYSLGIILYEMLTGRIPFEGKTPLSVAVKQKSEKPIDPRRINSQIPENISRLILKCLQKNKDLRDQNVSALLEELRKIEKQMPDTDKVLPKRKTTAKREITVKFSLKKALIPAAVFISVLIIGLLIWKILPRDGATVSEGDRPSLAVMHFENNTGDLNLDHWRKAISDLLVADLGQSKFLRVLSGEKLFDVLKELNLENAEAYSSKDLKEVASKAGVQYVLMGRLTKAGNTLRVNTTLMKAETEEIIGREQVEGTGDESLFDIVDELTKLVKEDFELSSAEIQADLDQNIKQITTDSQDAFRYYRDGMDFKSQGEYMKAISLLEAAVAVDPEFAMAYRGLYICYFNLGYQGEAVKNLEKAYEQREHVSQRERYSITAEYFRQTEKTYDQSIQAYQQLLKLYPDDEIANNNLGLLYMSLERWDDAIERLLVNQENKARGLQTYMNLANAYLAKDQPEKAAEPLEYYLEHIRESIYIRGDLAQVYIFQGQFDQALAELDKLLSENPSFEGQYFIRGSIHQMKGEWNRAEAEYKKLLETENPNRHHQGRNVLCNLYLMQGRFQEAEEQAEEAVEMSQLVEESGLEANWYLTQAYIHFLQKEWDESTKAWKTAQGLASEMGNSGLQRKVQFFKTLTDLKTGPLNQAEESTETLKAMIQEGMNPKEMRLFHLTHGLLLEHKGKSAEAVSEIRKGLSLLSSIDGTKAWFLNAMAQILYQSQDFNKAQEILEEAVEDMNLRLQGDYFFSKNLFLMAQILEDKGMDKDAKKYYAEFLSLWKNADEGLPLKQEALNRFNSL